KAHRVFRPRPFEGGEDVRVGREADDAVGHADHLGPVAVDLAPVADLAVPQLGGITDVHQDAIGVPYRLRIAVGHAPGVAQERGRFTPDAHNVFEPSVRHRRLGEVDQVGFGALDALHTPDALNPTLRDDCADVHIVHVFMADPDVGLAVVHQLARLPEHAQQE